MVLQFSGTMQPSAQGVRFTTPWVEMKPGQGLNPTHEVQVPSVSLPRKYVDHRITSHELRWGKEWTSTCVVNMRQQLTDGKYVNILLTPGKLTVLFFNSELLTVSKHSLFFSRKTVSALKDFEKPFARP